MKKYGYEFEVSFDGEYRTIIRSWVEVEGYVEVVQQEWIDSAWVDVNNSSAIEVNSLINAVDIIKTMKEKGMI